MIDLAYIGGFFDGEGSIGIYKHPNKPHHLKIQLVQNESPASFGLMHALKARFGGSVSRSPTISGKWKLNWQVSADKASEFLKAIQPHLRLKSDQAELALAWWEERKKIPCKRGANGKLLPKEINHDQDKEVADLLKALKR